MTSKRRLRRKAERHQRSLAERSLPEYHTEEWWERHPDVPRCPGVWTKQGRCAAVAGTCIKHREGACSMNATYRTNEDAQLLVEQYIAQARPDLIARLVRLVDTGVLRWDVESWTGTGLADGIAGLVTTGTRGDAGVFAVAIDACPNPDGYSDLGGLVHDDVLEELEADL